MSEIRDVRIIGFKTVLHRPDTHFYTNRSTFICGLVQEVGYMYLVTSEKAKVTCQGCNEWLHA